MDNIGPYLTYKELLERLYPSTYVSYKGTLTLSNKVGNTFDYVSTLVLELGDTVCQGDYIQRISSLDTSPNKLTLYDATNFTIGTAYAFRTTETEDSLNTYRLLAMEKIDLYTGQWFNKREFIGSNALTFEGNNSYILHFSVPIIEINSLKINDGDDVLAVEDYRIFNSRTLPDDRRNPRIKLISESSSVYRNSGVNLAGFYSYRRQIIEGSFGFLEHNGNTPEAIKWATSRLVMLQLQYDPEDNSSNLSIKKEKTDLHEVEYFDQKTSDATDNGNLTGDVEVDKLIRMYKTPIQIGGTDPLYSYCSTYYR